MKNREWSDFEEVLTLTPQQQIVADLKRENEDLLEENTDLLNKIDCMEDLLEQYSDGLRNN